MSPALKCRDGVLDGGIGRDHDEKRFRTELEHAVQHRDPVGAGELHVAQDDLRLEGFDLGKGRWQGRGPWRPRSTRPARNSLSVAAITSSSSTIKIRPRGGTGSPALASSFSISGVTGFMKSRLRRPPPAASAGAGPAEIGFARSPSSRGSAGSADRWATALLLSVAA